MPKFCIFRKIFNEMDYNVTLPLPQGWACEQDCYEEVAGEMITHLNCHLTPAGSDTAKVAMDIYVGDMPEGTTAEDEAFANYADIIGWDDDEDDDQSPIAEWKFQKKRAFGFSGICEDESVMLVMCVEIKQGVLLIASVVAENDDELSKWAEYLDHHLRISKA